MQMTIIYLILVGLSVYLFISFLNTLQSTHSPASFHKKIIYAYHGLRCYSKGLNKSESSVVEALSKKLNTKEYYIFNNLILETETSSTQIDHIVVSPFGIFVIETKDWSGWIFASSGGKVWTQTFPRGKRYSSQNPLHQNYRHIKILEEYLPFVSNDCFKNIAVFTRNSEFKTERPSNVFYIDEISAYIENFSDVIISKALYFMVIGKLSQLCQSTDISPQNHILNLNHEHIKT